MKVKRI